MPMIAHIADIHLGAAPYNFEERYNDIFESFEFVIDTVLRERPDALVIAGDLFDKPRPENRVIRRAIRLLRRLSDKGLPVIVAHGEHDTPTQRDETILIMLSDVLDRFYAPHVAGARDLKELADRFTIKLGKLTIYVTPFIKGSPTKRESLTKGVFNLFRGGKRTVLLGHFSLENEFPRDTFKLALSDLPSVSYVALGHIHKHIINLDATPPYAYPGVMDPLKIDEARLEQSKLLLVDLSGDSPSIQSVPIPVRPQLIVEAEITSSIDVVASVDEIRSKVKKRIAKVKGGKPPLVHLVLRLPVSTHRTLVIRRIREALEPLRERGVLVRIKIEELVDEGLNKERVVGSSRLDLVEIAYKLFSKYGLSREDAEIVVRELVSALAIEEDEAKAAALIEDLAKRRDPRVWEKIARGEAGKHAR